MTKTSHQIAAFFPGATVRGADKDYTCPSEQWINKLFRFYKGVLFGFNVFKWKPHNDCDDKAAGFRWLAGVLWGREKEQPTEGVAVMEVWYIRGDGEAHAINAVLTKWDKLKFVEPQGPRYINLTPAEKASIYFVRY